MAWHSVFARPARPYRKRQVFVDHLGAPGEGRQESFDLDRAEGRAGQPTRDTTGPRLPDRRCPRLWAWALRRGGGAAGANPSDFAHTGADGPSTSLRMREKVRACVTSPASRRYLPRCLRRYDGKTHTNVAPSVPLRALRWDVGPIGSEWSLRVEFWAPVCVCVCACVSPGRRGRAPVRVRARARVFAWDASDGDNRYDASRLLRLPSCPVG